MTDEEKENMDEKIRSNYMVPMVVEQTGRGERAYDIYSRSVERIFTF